MTPPSDPSSRREAKYTARLRDFEYAPGETLMALDSDLAALAQQTVTDPRQDPAEAAPFRSGYHHKRFDLRSEFIGASELCFVHALVIAHLRKAQFPQHAPALFQRLWAEHGAHLIDHLDTRWLISAIATFGDHGVNLPQRAVGLALNTAFGFIKLYEFERLYSGQSPDRPFDLTHKAKAALPLGMHSYSLADGDLDIALLSRLRDEASACPIVAPLAHHLLDRLTADRGTVLRRFARMRQTLAKTTKGAEPKREAHVPPLRPDLTPQTLRWGVVSTIKAPLPDIARFAAHHIELGAQALHLYLDAPDAEAEAYLTRDPRITVTQCDAAYWQSCGVKRFDEHQRRQPHNATHALTRIGSDLDWLAHIDVDEFILAQRAVADALCAVTDAHAAARLIPAEALAPDHGTPEHFKLTHRHVDAPKSVLQDIYPTFGLHLYGGFLSHTDGKQILRCGLPDMRFGIHRVKQAGVEVTNRTRPPGLYLAHLHAPSWEVFRRHLAFRMQRGAYRPRSSRPELGQAELLRFLIEEDGEAGLRLFFDEVCADTETLRARLAQHNMLLHHKLDLDGAVARVFGRLR